MTFENGTKVWSWLSQVENDEQDDPLPEFALMDIRMPGYRGDQLAQRIRQTPAIQHIPIVLMTAFVLSDGEREQMMKDCGVDLIINKPLPDFMKLQTVFDEIIQSKAQSTDSQKT